MSDADADADRKRRYDALAAEFETVAAAVRDRLAAANEALFDRLDDRERYGRNLRRAGRYTGSADAERARAAYERVRETPTDIVRAVVSEDFDPPTVGRPDGESVEIRKGNRQTELSHPDRDYRRRVYEAYAAEIGRFEGTLTRALAGKLAAGVGDAEVRGYDSVRDRDLRARCYPETGLRSRLPESVHDALLDGVRRNLGPYHDGLAYRRDRLGVDRLRPWDLRVPLVDEPPEFGYEETVEHLSSALEPLGDDYVARLESLLDERRVDAYPTEGKRADFPAYCPSSPDDGPYVLANFRGDVRSAFHLCHELGHAMHVEHHREGPARYATCPRPVEEVPSLLHELLFADHLLERDDTLADAAESRLLELLTGNFYDAALYAAFVHETASIVEGGDDLTSDRAARIFADLLAAFRAPVSYEGVGDPEAPGGREWLGYGVREPYSNYQYVLGATGALVVHERLRTGELSGDEYRTFLRETGREPSVTLFDRLGLDVTTTAPFADAADRVSALVDRFAASD